MSDVTPPGWPSDLPGPLTEEFGARVSGWLLERCPPDTRGAFMLRRHPLALAHLAQHHCDAVVRGQRAAYAGVRRELAADLDAEVIDQILLDCEALGHQAVRTQREVALVSEALRGKRWRAKL